jgi:hypothetical protein
MQRPALPRPSLADRGHEIKLDLGCSGPVELLCQIGPSLTANSCRPAKQAAPGGQRRPVGDGGALRAAKSDAGRINTRCCRPGTAPAVTGDRADSERLQGADSSADSV